MYIVIFLILLVSILSASCPVYSFSMSTSSSSTVSPSSSDGGGDDMRFSKFQIPSKSIFYRTRFSAAFVNLRPIVPGHVLIMPERIVPRLNDLCDDEYDDLWRSVRNVQKILQRQYPDSAAFNIAVQDGKAAGQSVPHVHVHVLPRKGGDFERNDQVYDELEAWAPTQRDAITKKESADNRDYLDVPDDEDRKDRTMEQMADEAAQYRKIFTELEKESS
mmetsp:Transcript_28221/g.68675  ORF Transcript_28221/g.68675 Transcript_28221/m.68675 type:complete len:219 (+) Transcript_28221:258-914(+)